MSNLRRLALIFILASATGLCACGEGNQALVTAAVPVQQVASNGGYRISNEDMLEIAVFMVPSLNRSVQVDANGRIELPLLGSLVAGGRTTRELEAEIARRLGEKYLRSPQVAVTVREGLAQRFAVDGAVLRPGIYVAKGETTLLQAIAQAGGLNDVGDLDDATIVRISDGERKATRYSLRAIRTGRATDPQVYGKDSVVVGESSTLNTLKFAKDIGAPIVGVGVGVARFAVP